jgi:hypothetical protein
MEQIRSYLESVKLARKQVFRNLTVFPLLNADKTDLDYLTLGQAIEKETIRITEKGDGGEVPELVLINSGDTCVLIIEGEELVGAKQNRIVNSTFLIPGKTETVLPVSCVEQGRWSYKSRTFKSGGRMMFSTLRREHQQRVRENLQDAGEFRSNLGEVWESIAEMSSRMKVSSPTDAMADVFESRGDDIDRFLESFQLVECQVGAIFAIDGRIFGIECFWYHDTFKRFFDKLLKSYALDALGSENGKETKSVEPAKANSFLASTAKSKGEAHVSPGIGENVRFESRSVSGASLVEGDRVLHLSAFKKGKSTRSRSVGFQSSSARRNRYL